MPVSLSAPTLSRMVRESWLLDTAKAMRAGTFTLISEVESARITDELRRQVFDDAFVEAYGPDFDGAVESGGPSLDKGNMDFSDPHLRQAALICIEEGQGSVSRLQRRLSVGHARAGKLMDMLEAMGIVSKHQGSKPREVLITEADLPEYFGR